MAFPPILILKEEMFQNQEDSGQEFWQTYNLFSRMEDSDQDWVKPFISALTVAHCSAIFPEVLPHVQRLCPEV